MKLTRESLETSLKEYTLNLKKSGTKNNETTSNNNI
jgi:hypothetical protein